MKEVERRFVPATEIRTIEVDGQKKIVGYAARFNSESEDMGFVETIAPGAFANALKRSDIRALFNHNPNYILGRVSANTLTVEEDAHGLHMEVSPPDTQWARDLSVSIARGDVTGQSFGFTVAKSGDSWENRDGKIHRTITEVDELFDVGPVVYPAYIQTDVSVALRSLDAWKAEQGQVVEPEPEVVTVERERLKLALQKIYI